MNADPSDEPTAALFDQWIKKGNDLEDAGEYVESERCYRVAAEHAPDSPRPWLNLGNLAFAQNAVEDAEHHYLHAIAMGGGPAAHTNLGNLYLQQECFAAAKRQFENALRLEDKRPGALLGLASVLDSEGKAAESLELLRSAVRRGLRDTYCLLELARRQLLVDVESAADTLELLPPEEPDGWILRSKFEAQRLYPEAALGNLEQAVALRPGDRALRTQLIFLSMFVENLKASWVSRWIGSAYRQPPTRRRISKFPDQIRIGYLSGDYCAHAAANYLLPMLANHSPGRFAVFAISNTAENDHVTARFKKLPIRWVDIFEMAQSRALEVVRALDLHILVDCSGHTASNRLEIFEERLAPLQVTNIGAMLPTGAREIDYRIASELTDPIGTAEAWNVEPLLRMPGAQAVYMEMGNNIPTTALPARKNGHVTVGFVNSVGKLNRETLQVFRILLETTDAHIRIVGISCSLLQTFIKNFFTGFNDRVTIAGRLSINGYLSTLAEIDVAVDSFPYTGSTTTIDCLLAGVPVFARVGPRPQMRSSYALLSLADLSEFCFESEEKRIAALQHHCRSWAVLEPLRNSLPQRIRESPIMDVSRFMNEWESLLIQTLHGT